MQKNYLVIIFQISCVLWQNNKHIERLQMTPSIVSYALATSVVRGRCCQTAVDLFLNRCSVADHIGQKIEVDLFGKEAVRAGLNKCEFDLAQLSEELGRKIERSGRMILIHPKFRGKSRKH